MWMWQLDPDRVVAEFPKANDHGGNRPAAHDQHVRIARQVDEPRQVVDPSIDPVEPAFGNVYMSIDENLVAACAASGTPSASFLCAYIAW